MSELFKLGLSPSDLKKIESLGFTSLKQIALAQPSYLGVGENKGYDIINVARNLIFNENVVDITAGRSQVKITMKHIDTAIFTSVNSVLNADKKYVNIKQDGNSIFFSQKYGYQSQFKKVLENAKNIQTILQAMKKEAEKQEGIISDREEILKFAKEKGFNGFWQDVFASITGNELVKQAITVSLFSTFDEPVHTLVIGEPGSAKTLIRDIIAGNFSGITTIGANATKAGLICNLSTGEPGLLTMSDRKVVLVDEFDKLPITDVQYCYELLSNGRCSVHSAKIHQDIVSNFIMIAFANPKTSTFGPNPLYDIGMDFTLMSRFSLIVRTQLLEEEERRKLFKTIFKGNIGISGMSEYYNQWAKLARKFQPKLIAKEDKLDDLINKINEIVEEHISTPLRRDLRMGYHLRRIAFSIARSTFSDVTNETLDKAYDIISQSIKEWET